MHFLFEMVYLLLKKNPRSTPDSCRHKCLLFCAFTAVYSLAIIVKLAFNVPRHNTLNTVVSHRPFHLVVFGFDRLWLPTMNAEGNNI